MPKKLFFCDKCKQYTMEEKECAKCGEPLRSPHPGKFSPIDKYQKYRIPLFKKKMEQIQQKK